MGGWEGAAGAAPVCTAGKSLREGGTVGPPSSFAADDRLGWSLEFRPLPLLRNPHVQTLLGHWLRGPGLNRPTRVHVLRLPDGDALVLHDTTPAGWRPGDPVAVLLHGLSGSHASAGVVRLAGLLLARGLRVVRLDLR